MLFLDPDKPIATCNASTCQDCSAGKELTCHFSLSDLVHFLLLVTPSMLIGGAGLVSAGIWWLILWLGLVIGYFGFIEIRVLCSHCPHYAEEGKSLKCWANYGSPKLWSFHPGPLALWEKIVFFVGLFLIWGIPLPAFVLTRQLFLLVIFLLTSVGFLITIRRSFCSRCMNFACPLNTVGEQSRKEFLARNPRIAAAWGEHDTGRQS